MLPKLAHASKLRIEIEGWRAKAKTLDNDLIKKRINELCDEILHLAKNIDNWHDPNIKGQIIPNLTGDIRDKITKKRLECQQLISMIK